jgi:hypothetical protein
MKVGGSHVAPLISTRQEGGDGMNTYLEPLRSLSYLSEKYQVSNRSTSLMCFPPLRRA